MNSYLTKIETLAIVLIFCTCLLISGINPYDRFTWFLEVLPAIIGIGGLFSTYRFYKFSRFTYWLLLSHAIILMIGGHYTYAKVPLFDYLAQIFDWKRNNYDKVGHFFQGFVPAFVTIELLQFHLKIKSWPYLILLTIFTCLGISAVYELLEWGVAVTTGTQADAFLGTQGYVWDTQSDMFWAFLGSLSAVLAIKCFFKKRASTLQILLYCIMVIGLFGCENKDKVVSPFTEIYIKDWSNKDAKTDWLQLEVKGPLKILKQTDQIKILAKAECCSEFMSWYLDTLLVPNSDYLFGVAINKIDPSITKIGLFSHEVMLEKINNQFSITGDFNQNNIPEIIYLGVYEDIHRNIGNIFVIRETDNNQDILRLYKMRTGNSENFAVITPYTDMFSIYFCDACDNSISIKWDGTEYKILPSDNDF